VLCIPFSAFAATVWYQEGYPSRKKTPLLIPRGSLQQQFLRRTMGELPDLGSHRKMKNDC